ncbi:MAG: XRE family transcriptional regulator [Clostridia bacterium]|nr:XRE family transcriptional regulator [Clostridia bacterium]NCC76164.1 XRE family transcriptional regulator [Clostridia bacterium]
MKSLQRILAENLKRVRAERGYSQERLAEIVDLHRTYISGIERGTRNVSLRNIEKIAQALDLSVVDLLTEPED